MSNRLFALNSLLSAAVFVAASTAALADAGETLKDLIAAEDATYEAWEALPLTVRTSLLVEARSTGYGQYVSRESNVYKPGEPVVLYVEPIGYSWAEEAGDLYRFGFDVDLVLKARDGSVISEQKQFLKTSQSGHAANQEFSMDLTLTIDGAPDGEYVLEYIIHDSVSGEATTVSHDFAVKS